MWTKQISGLESVVIPELKTELSLDEENAKCWFFMYIYNPSSSIIHEYTLFRDCWLGLYGTVYLYEWSVWGPVNLGLFDS